MRVKQILAFFAAVAICVPAAVYRFKDSGHAMGRLSADGGHVRQALKLDPGKRWYVVTVGGTVSRSYRGDARVAVEGRPEMEYEIHRSGPVLDLGMRRRARSPRQCSRRSRTEGPVHRLGRHVASQRRLEVRASVCF